MTLKILFIAADPPPESSAPKLDWSHETELLGESPHKFSFLLGDVSSSRLLTFSSGKKYDVVHCAVHGGQLGITLTDGEFSRENLLRFLRGVQARVVFLNACFTPLLGQYLIDQGIENVVVYNREILDDEAISSANLFYQKLKTLWNLEEAVQSISSGDGVVSLLSKEYDEPKSPIILGGVSYQEMRALEEKVEHYFRVGRYWDIGTLLVLVLVIFYIVFVLS